MTYRAKMPGELSKLNRPCEELKTALLALIPSRLHVHPRAGEPSEGLRRAQDFIQAKERCAGDDFVLPDNRKRGGEDKGPPADNHLGKDDERIGRFHTMPRNILMEIKGNPILRRPKPIDTPAKLRNKNKYCEYHEDHRHTTAKCLELEKGLYELADRGQLNRFLEKGGGRDHVRCNPEGKKDDDVDHNAEIIATIIRGIDSKDLSEGYRKAQIQNLSQVIAARELKPLVEPPMTIFPEDIRPSQTPHNNSLLI
ncbi:hypothetical protein Cgig2_017166 [Carnegiea gigantea]|uniref:Reverse transcriptase domain-containing protein n=1 Tax=Carnegiea gigantea TaxID=171969 RepID=A0A9Q1KAX0_9CARY|nr:hypothetical protein Cgig2_017166 [Carnegiea gigantea]